VVSDDGEPNSSVTNSFTVLISERNSTPALSAQADRSIAELSTLTVTNSASDSDVPANNLVYTLVDAPEGATINGEGVITWTPSEVQGPGTNTITTVVTDNGVPSSSAMNSFSVVVTEVNSAPMLPPQADRTIAELTPLSVTNTASDIDLPANLLTYVLVDPPPGAVIDTNGVIAWTPTYTQTATEHVLTTVVTDDGFQSLSVTNMFAVEVTPAPSPPVILSIALSNGIATITWSAKAGRRYRMEYTEAINNANWIEVPPEVMAESATATTTNVVGAAEQRFYRVLLRP
jgi:hypothetical protein